MNIAKGAVVGKYRLETPLAQGGMGAVWMARHVRLGNAVAVKFLAAALVSSRRSLARFEREARAATTIHSPHVIHVQDFGVEGDTPYLVMEFLEGENLGSRLSRVSRMSLEEAARVLVQVGKALRRAHAVGIVHRDLKPGNLFLTVEDDEEVVKVLDFGIAKETDKNTSDQTEPGTMLGSPNYMSPEQAAGDRTVDHRSDLWSMGVVLYQMVTGVLPFRGHNIGSVLKKVFLEDPPRMAAVAPDLPEELDAFFRKALAKRRDDRFQHIEEMVEDFVNIAAPDLVMPPSSSGPLSSQRRLQLVAACDATLESYRARHPSSGETRTPQEPSSDVSQPKTPESPLPAATPPPISVPVVSSESTHREVPTVKLGRSPTAERTPTPEPTPPPRSAVERARLGADALRAVPWFLLAVALGVIAALIVHMTLLAPRQDATGLCESWRTASGVAKDNPTLQE